jgi:hypothetical protein
MKVNLHFGLALLAVGMVVFPCQAVQQSRHQPGNTLQARQWDVMDITFEVGAIPEKPVDCEFTAVFKDDTGTRMEVVGFYSGDRCYVMRFTPPSAGTWRYVTRSKVPALDAQKGTLSVRKARPGRKGGVVIDPAAPREFRYANGDTYYPIAFESDWLFALDAENATDIPLTRKLVDSLAGHGFNQVVMNVFAGTYPTHYWQCAAWNVIIPDIEAMAPETRPRLDYYRHMRRFVDKYDIGRLKAEQKHSNSGFCLHNGKDLYIYNVPKENVSIGVQLPKDQRGKMMTGTWFNPFDGTFSDPREQEVTQWPGFQKPGGDQFAILVVEIQSDVGN